MVVVVTSVTTVPKSSCSHSQATPSYGGGNPEPSPSNDGFEDDGFEDEGLEDGDFEDDDFEDTDTPSTFTGINFQIRQGTVHLSK